MMLDILSGGATSFGQMVAAHRKCEEMTQEELAKKVGCSKSYISQIEKGTADAKNAEMAAKIAEAFGVSAELFIQMAFQAQIDRVKRLRDRFLVKVEARAVV